MLRLKEEKEMLVQELENINYNIYKELNNGKDYDEVYNSDLFKKRNIIIDKLNLIKNELTNNKKVIISDDIIELKKTDDDIIGDYSIYLKNNNEVIGTITYKGYHNVGSNDIGYVIKENYRGKGYAKKSLELLSEHLYNNNINDFWISCYKTNIPSVKIITSYGGNLLKEENDILLFECFTQKRNKKNNIKK